MSDPKAFAVPLPLHAKCPACGRRWAQSEPWPEGSVLTCQCGAFAEVDLEDGGPSPAPGHLVRQTVMLHGAEACPPVSARVVHLYDADLCDTCGKPATYLWRDEVEIPAEPGDAYARYEVGDVLHRACEEHRSAETRAPR